jgi:GNAT superfamily N-acetyltransferase
LKIRRLRTADYKTVKRIEKTVLDEYRRYLKRTGERDEVPSGIQPAYFNYYVRTGSNFGALVDGELVGYVLSQPMFFAEGERKILWLDYIAILSKFRRKGIGSSLLTKVESWARRHGCNMLYTSLNPNNSASRLLLDRKGFEVRRWMKAAKEL